MDLNLFNIGSNTVITVNEIAKKVIKEMGLKKVELYHIGGKRGWKGDVPIVMLNNKALRQIGWKNEYSSSEAVIKTIRVLLDKK